MFQSFNQCLDVSVGMCLFGHLHPYYMAVPQKWSAYTIDYSINLATLNVKIPKPHIGLAISFLMFAIFVFLTLRRKENCPLWLKIVSFILPAPLPLLAAGFAGISTYLVLLLSWSVLRDLMILYLFLFVGYEFCSLVIANIALKYETQRSEKEWPN